MLELWFVGYYLSIGLTGSEVRADDWGGGVIGLLNRGFSEDAEKRDEGAVNVGLGAKSPDLDSSYWLVVSEGFKAENIPLPNKGLLEGAY